MTQYYFGGFSFDAIAQWAYYLSRSVTLIRLPGLHSNVPILQQSPNVQSDLKRVEFYLERNRNAPFYICILQMLNAMFQNEGLQEHSSDVIGVITRMLYQIKTQDSGHDDFRKKS